MQTALLLKRNKRLIAILLTVVCLLLVPLVAMVFTNEVNWDETDFIVAGILLFGSGLLFEVAARKGGSLSYRAASGMAIFTGLVLVWMNLAVGLIGNEDNPANLMYAGVLAVCVIGAAIARFRARGMSRALFVTAAAQLLVPMVALIIWRPELNGGLVAVFFLNAIFALLWLGSGALYLTAAEAANPPRPSA